MSDNIDTGWWMKADISDRQRKTVNKKHILKKYAIQPYLCDMCGLQWQRQEDNFKKNADVTYYDSLTKFGKEKKICPYCNGL